MARLEAAFARLGAEYDPPRGWEARVIERIRGLSPPWWRRCPWMLAIPMGAMGAIASTVVLLPRFSPGAAMVAEAPMPASDSVAFSGELVLDVARTPAGSTMRGSPATAGVGDRIHVTATGGDRYRAIWVYHDDRELVVACPAGASCTSSGDRMTAELTLQTVGPYSVLAVASRSPLPEPQGSLDIDWAAAEGAGATIEVQRFNVR